MVTDGPQTCRRHRLKVRGTLAAPQQQGRQQVLRPLHLHLQQVPSRLQWREAAGLRLATPTHGS